VEGGFALGLLATIAEMRSFSSTSNSIEFAREKMKKFSEPSEQLKTIFTSELAWSQVRPVIYRFDVKSIAVRCKFCGPERGERTYLDIVQICLRFR
jgi:hypothetical protein